MAGLPDDERHGNDETPAVNSSIELGHTIGHIGGSVSPVRWSKDSHFAGIAIIMSRIAVVRDVRIPDIEVLRLSCTIFEGIWYDCMRRSAGDIRCNGKYGIVPLTQELFHSCKGDDCIIQGSSIAHVQEVANAIHIELAGLKDVNSLTQVGSLRPIIIACIVICRGAKAHIAAVFV